MNYEVFDEDGNPAEDPWVPRAVQTILHYLNIEEDDIVELDFERDGETLNALVKLTCGKELLCSFPLLPEGTHVGSNSRN